MKTAKLLRGALVSLVTTPIWFYVMYQVLTAIHATDVTWLLFWVYVPASLIASAITIADAAQTAEEKARSKVESEATRLDRLYARLEKPAGGSAR